MPEPLKKSSRYMPGLDGLRAVAVAAVVAYHLGIGWAPGGLLGVGVFFTLSGYLITDLLLGAWHKGSLGLRDFWIRRARRLLPALYLMLTVVVIWVAIAHSSQISDVRGQTLSALLYVNNWWQINQHISYFTLFGPPSPLSHLWSLAVEEQFYLIWPWVLLIGLRVVHERKRSIPVRPRLAMVTLVLAAASAIEMAVLFHPGFDQTRIYEGTDTRAFGLLFGAALAMVWPSRALTGKIMPGARNILDGLGVVGLIGIILLIWRTSQYSAFLYQGGLVLLSICTVLVVAACAHPASRLGRVLGCKPLRWIGVRSYAIYLWHEPIIVLTTPARLLQTPIHPHPPIQPLRAILQIGLAVGISALSWRYVEEPIRHGALGRWWQTLHSVSLRAYRQRRQARFVLVGVTLVLALAIAGLAGATAPSHGGGQADSAGVGIGPGGSTGSGGSSGSGGSAGKGASDPPGSSKTGSGAKGGGAAARAGAASRNASGKPATSCTSVVHVGDSTSDGLDSSDYLPDPAQRIPAQYARVGVKHTFMRVTGGTSIVETLPGTVNALTTVQQMLSSGYHGCWVFALGTNDTADVSVGSNVGLVQRIMEMMQAVHGEDVMWVNVKTLLSSGPYSESGMEDWDNALQQVCAKYPHNMRIYDWAAAAQNKWFITDGIHYYSDGYAARAHLIADALAEAYPAGKPPSSSCTVKTPTINLPVLGVHG
jgi:peptidoglycan/LPS O-acetylase OafA/YrhL